MSVKQPKTKQPKVRDWETVRYTDGPDDLPDLDRVVLIEDFLPRPEDLVFRPKGVKVTLVLSEESVAFFKEEGERLRAPYQRMIRNLIDLYVKHMREETKK
ncbi:MAG: CopG family transcriptional regulator [Candidatus Hydrogenedentes bacterium]|nr:CopG family transcriptional regulator [Candidatus Hydrogenedentota bacterium]